MVTTAAEMLERSTWNTKMCACPICGHTKESTCERLTEKVRTGTANVKGLKPCICCVGVGSEYFDLVK